jgi:hypothetical protein
LNLTSVNLATLKKRNSIPYSNLLDFCALKKISINWLLYNQDPSSLIQTTDKYWIRYYPHINVSAGGGAFENSQEANWLQLPEYMIQIIGGNSNLKNIEAINSKFSFAPIYVNEYSFFQIKSRKNEDAGEMKYKPNITGSVGAKMRIKNFSITYVYALPQSDIFGKTKSTNLVLNLQKRVFGLKLYWIHYRGLYIDTLDRFRYYNEMYTHGIDSAFILRPDIELNNIGFQNYFVFLKVFR